jgi:[glutamine synthetase] adenylyltransferase / [glutamine synthetase]-adenylyl-L-tyrosine phosphorylase
LKPAERETDVKLGWGGLSDVEWLAQMLQLAHGKDNRALRVAPTVEALSRLAQYEILTNAEADFLQGAYFFLAGIRNALWLRTGTALDVFPSDAKTRRILARQLGYEDGETEAGERLWHDVHGIMQEVRRIFLERFGNV